MGWLFMMLAVFGALVMGVVLVMMDNVNGGAVKRARKAQIKRNGGKR